MNLMLVGQDRAHLWCWTVTRPEAERLRAAAARVWNIAAMLDRAAPETKWLDMLTDWMRNEDRPPLVGQLLCMALVGERMPHLDWDSSEALVLRVGWSESREHCWLDRIALADRRVPANAC
jgi:hypothetical protein